MGVPSPRVIARRVLPDEAIRTPLSLRGAPATWQFPAVRFPIHRSSRNAATLPREIPTGLTALGMTEKASSFMSLRGGQMPDVAIRIFCDAMHRAAHKSRRRTDSHGPYGPRNDKKGCPLPVSLRGAPATWQSPAVKFPIHRGLRNANTLPREIPTGLTALGMTKRPPSPVSLRGSNATVAIRTLCHCEASSFLKGVPPSLFSACFLRKYGVE